MRLRLWNNLANILFKSIYCNKCSSIAGLYERCYSVFLAVTSAGCVAAWAFWKAYPAVWAIIVATAQVLQVVKPHLPFLNAEKDLLELSFEYECLFLKYERLWYDYEYEKISLSEAEEQFFQLRQKEVDIEKANKATQCPHFSFLMTTAQNETDNALRLHFATEDSNEQRENTTTETIAI